VHWVATKHVLRYLKGMADYGLNYERGDGVILIGYTDLDWVGCVADMKSSSSCFFILGSTMVSWLVRSKTLVALSSIDAEYMVANQTSCEAI
jgi:hypothetical protein